MSFDPRQALLSIFQSALAAVDGCERVHSYLQQHPIPAPVFLISIGKAACAMAQGAHAALGARVVDALVVTKRGHAGALPWPVLVAGHPLPDEQSLVAGQRLIDFVTVIPPDATVLVLLSGGASALVEALPEDMNLAQLRALNDWLLASGLDIVAMNRLRKRLSRIKGGRLAGLLARHGLAPTGGTALFQWVESGRAAGIQDALAQQGIWVRRFDAPASLRFGLPGAEAEWQRLETALRELR